MNKQPKKTTWENWLQKAESDLKRARASLKENIYYGCCFVSQQAGEKALKAYLISKKLNYRRIHDLSALLEDCIEQDKSFEDLLEQAATLSGYYIEARYPDMSLFMEYKQNQALEATNFAQDIVTFVKKKI